MRELDETDANWNFEPFPDDLSNYIHTVTLIESDVPRTIFVPVDELGKSIMKKRAINELKQQAIDVKFKEVK